jgi:phosphatidylethanolamine-binding protein (PEBP) family uncharacterized protein
VCATLLGSGLAAATLQVTSSAFPANGAIPSKYTCDGQGMNPPLAFTGIPAKTQSLVLIVDDPDVPKNLMPSGVFDHWLIWDLAGQQGNSLKVRQKRRGPQRHGTTGLYGSLSSGSGTPVSSSSCMRSTPN